MSLHADVVELVASTDGMRIFQGTVHEQKWRFFKSTRRPIRAVDREGVIRVQRSDGVILPTQSQRGLAELRRLWEETTIYNGDSVITPDMFLIAGAHVVDLSGVSALDQALAIVRSELEGLAGEAPVALISIRGARGM